jgi:hypothetical protein
LFVFIESVETVETRETLHIQYTRKDNVNILYSVNTTPPTSITLALGYSVRASHQLTLIHSALLLLTLRETNKKPHELGIEEQLLDTGEESGLVQAHGQPLVVLADRETSPLVVPAELDVGHLLVPTELEAGTLAVPAELEAVILVVLVEPEAGPQLILVEPESEPWDGGAVSLLANVYGHLVARRVVPNNFSLFMAH